MFGSSVFVKDNQVTINSSWLQVVPNVMIGIFIWRRELQQGDHYMGRSRDCSKAPTEQGTLRMSGNHQKLRKSKEGSSSKNFRESVPNTLISDFCHSELREKLSAVFNPQGVVFVLAALINYYTYFQFSLNRRAGRSFVPITYS